MSTSLQQVQALLDTDIASKLQVCLSGAYSTANEAGVAMETVVLKCCYKALDFCSHLQDEFRTSEPCVSLIYALSSPAWISALVQILRSSKAPQSLQLLSLHCLHLMSQTKISLRAWGTFEVFSTLLNVSHRTGQLEATSRSLAIASLRSAFIFYPEYSTAMLNAKYVSVEISATDETSPVYPSVLRSEGFLSELMRDANDLSFGSTIREQLEFGYKLKAWINCNIPLDNSRSEHSQELIEEYQRWRAPIFEVVNQMGRWIPTVGLSLELNGSSHINDIVSKKAPGEAELALQKALEAQERLKLSSDTLSVQLYCLKRIMSYALSLELNCAIADYGVGAKVGAIGTILNVLRENASFIKQDDQSSAPPKGILNVVDHFSSAGLYSDSSEVLNFVLDTIQMITSMIRVTSASKASAKRSEFTSGLLSRGVVNTICGALRFETDYLRSIVKAKRVAAHLTNDHLRLIQTCRSAWDALLSFDDNVIVDGIESCGLNRLLAEEWLLDKTMLTLVSSSLTDHNPEAYVIVNEAIELGRTAIVRSKKSTLQRQISQHIFDNQVLDKVIEKIRTLTKRDPPMSLDSFLRTLGYLASINDNFIDGAFVSIKVPKTLLAITRQLGGMHPITVEAWSKWWASRTNATSALSATGTTASAGSPTKKGKAKEEIKSSIGAKELFKADKGEYINIESTSESGILYYSHNYTIYVELWGAFEVRKPSDGALVLDGPQMSTGPTVAHDIAAITDRLGHFLLPIRKKFSKFSTKLRDVEEPFVTVENCQGLFI